MQRSQSSQTLGKENEFGGLTLPDFKAYLKDNSDQDSMVFIKGQERISVEQNKESRNKPIHKW